MDLSEKPYAELQAMAKERNIAYAGVKKEDLIRLITEHDMNPPGSQAPPAAAQPPTTAVPEQNNVVLSQDQFNALMQRINALESGKGTTSAPPPSDVTPEFKALMDTLSKTLQKETNGLGVASFGTVPPEDRLPEKHIFYTRAPQLHTRFLLIGPVPEGLPRGMQMIHFERVFNPVQVKYEGSVNPTVVNLLKFETYDKLLVQKMQQDARYGIQWFDSVGEAFRASVDDTYNRLLEQQRLALRSNPDPNSIFAAAQMEGIKFDKLDNPFKVAEQVAELRAKRLYKDTLAPVKSLVDYHERGKLLEQRGDNIPSVLTS